MRNTKIPLSRIDPISASDAVIRQVNVTVFENDSAIGHDGSGSRDCVNVRKRPLNGSPFSRKLSTRRAVKR